ncbi:MAG: hypothetical protein ABJ178_14185, partial [Marinomonas sp.]
MQGAPMETVCFKAAEPIKTCGFLSLIFAPQSIMSFETLTALALFAFVSSATPGPNNLMLMASGANFGFWRSVPHM